MLTKKENKYNFNTGDKFTYKDEKTVFTLLKNLNEYRLFFSVRNERYSALVDPKDLLNKNLYKIIK